MDRRTFLQRAAAASALFNVARGSRANTVGPPPLIISVDPRVELFSVILFLGDFRGFPGAPVVTELEFPYRRGVEDHFRAFREHPVVDRYAAMASKGFWLAHPVGVMLHLSQPPVLSKQFPIDELALRLAGGRYALEAFLADARDFASASDFKSWFDSQGSFYHLLSENYRAGMEWNYVDDLVAYYGESREAYNLILAPLFHPGGFGPRARRPDGRYDAFAVIGSREVRDGVAGFGSGAAARRVMWHEFSHAHINHLTERNLARLDKPVSILQKDVRERAETIVPWDVHVADWVSEHVVRGVTTRLAHLKSGPEQAAAALAREEQQFPYVGEVANVLKCYESARHAYPTLASFFPRIVKLFEQLAARG